MAYQTIQEFNATGLDGIVIYLATTIPIFTPILLISMWLTISLIIYMGSKKYSGQGDIFAAFAAAGFFIVVIGTIMTFAFGAINLYSLSITVIIAIVSFILLMIRRNRD